MKLRPIILRAAADRDLLSAVDYYAREAGPDVASDFIDRVENAFSAVAETPEAGSSRWAWELDLPDVRTWRMRGFPWLIVYYPKPDHIDIWRIIHAKRDLPAWLNAD